MKNERFEAPVYFSLVPVSGQAGQRDVRRYRAVMRHDAIDMADLAKTHDWSLASYLSGTQPMTSIREAINVLSAMVDGVLRDGRTRRLGDMLEIRGDVRGTFASDDEPFDPKRHAFVLNLRPLKGMVECIRSTPPKNVKKPHLARNAVAPTSASRRCH